MISGLLCLLLAVLVPSCAPVEQTNESLTVWVADPFIAQKHFSYALSRFQAAHPGMEVKFAEGPAPVDLYAPSEDIAEEYKISLAQYAGRMRTEVMGRSGPDLIIFDEDTFPNLCKTVAAGVFAPLDGFIQGDETWMCNDFGIPERYSERIMEAGRYRGKQYFVPLRYAMPVVLSTKDSLRKYGFSPEEMLRYDQLISLMAEASQDGVQLVRRDFDSTTGYILWDGAVKIDYYNKSVSVDREKMEALMTDYKTARQYQEKNPINPSLRYAALGEGRLLCDFTDDGEMTTLAGAVNYYAEPYVSPLRNADGEIAVYLKIGAAINAYSKNQQNAYEFLKYAMQAYGDYAEADSVYWGLPVNDEAFARWNASRKAEASSTDLGPVPAKVMPDSYYEDILTWHENIGRVYFDTGLDEQVLEWFLPYYRGERSFASCCDVMENALGIIVSE